ncbi:hypothetical protein [Smaragdicoccus niigatensis]|uniref:hypothetical protein n=1 Tax=Smaragdicoccus niigatensis TaxID=359359 RepID=UPI00037D7575|nr:hypothetical protein [Smaragdicoccus niigatensis]
MSSPFGPQYQQYPRPSFQQWNYPPPPAPVVSQPPRYLPQPDFPPVVRLPNLAVNIVVTLAIWLLFILGSVAISTTFDGSRGLEPGSETMSVQPQQAGAPGYIAGVR